MHSYDVTETTLPDSKYIKKELCKMRQPLNGRTCPEIVGHDVRSGPYARDSGGVLQVKESNKILHCLRH